MNQKNQCGAAALHHACRCQNHIAVKKLLRHAKLDVNLFDDNGDTPLFHTIVMSEYLFEDMSTTGLTGLHKAWDMTSLRLLLDHNESLILAKNNGGNQLIHFARWRLRLICNVPLNNQNESLTKDFLKIIDELEVYMTKAHWKIFQYMIKAED